jgi:hypothetical protein
MACLGRDIVLAEPLVKRRGPTRQAETLQGQVRSSHEIEPTQDYRIGRNRVRTDFIAR